MKKVNICLFIKPKFVDQFLTPASSQISMPISDVFIWISIITSIFRNHILKKFLQDENNNLFLQGISWQSWKCKMHLWISILAELVGVLLCKKLYYANQLGNLFKIFSEVSFGILRFNLWIQVWWDTKNSSSSLQNIYLKSYFHLFEKFRIIILEIIGFRRVSIDIIKMVSFQWTDPWI